MAVVKDDARKRTDKLAKLMGWNRKAAAGALLFIWEDSQQEGIVAASADEICDWADVELADERAKFIEALQSRTVRFITKLSDGTFLIHGNEAAIKIRDGAREQRRQAAVGRWEKERRAKLAPAASESMRAACEPDADRMRDGCGSDAGNGNGNAYAEGISEPPKAPLEGGPLDADAFPSPTDSADSTDNEDWPVEIASVVQDRRKDVAGTLPSPDSLDAGSELPERARQAAAIGKVAAAEVFRWAHAPPEFPASMFKQTQSEQLAWLTDEIVGRRLSGNAARCCRARFPNGWGQVLTEYGAAKNKDWFRTEVRGDFVAHLKTQIERRK